MAIEISWRGRSRSVDKEDRGRKSFQGSGPFRIGRAADCDLVLTSAEISRRHAEIFISDGNVTVSDLGSDNGTRIDGQRITRAKWAPAETLQIGPIELRYQHVAAPARSPDERNVFEVTVVPRREEGGAVDRGGDAQFHGRIFDKRIVAIDEIKQSGRQIRAVTYATIGGGIGSFVWVDFLRIYGVPASEIRALGLAPDKKPYAKYSRLCHNSQIPDHERLRSNSISAPDNIWGFPGYASREMMRDLRAGRLSGFKHVLQVFGEEMLTESFTPRIGDMKRSLDIEGRRIGWDDMWVHAQVVGLRKTDDERYVIAYRVPSAAAPGLPREERERFLLARYVHIATGYPAFNFLRDLQDYREAHPNSRAVVNAYEEHDDIYRALEKQGGTVMIRGRGIVASRIIQRISEARERNSNIRILHVVRSEVRHGQKFDLATRPVKNHVEHQPFNWPKACWGGTYKKQLEAASPNERVQLLAHWGGTTTVNRASWNEIIENGTRDGWFKMFFGNIRSIDDRDGRIVAQFEPSAHRGNFELVADYVIDCTGLIAALEETQFIRDLVKTYDLQRNRGSGGESEVRRLSGLYVTNDFEVPGLQNGQAKAWAAGVVTINGPFAAVDSFLGLQYVALRSADQLGAIGAPYVSKFGPLKSFHQWLKWCAGSPP